MLHDTLDAQYQAEQYANANFILFIGVLFGLLISTFLIVTFLNKYKTLDKLIACGISTGLTLGILFFYSWGAIMIKYADRYSQLDLIQQLSNASRFYILFAIYILPNPTYFWLITLLLFHGFLIIFIKTSINKKRGKK